MQNLMFCNTLFFFVCGALILSDLSDLSDMSDKSAALSTEVVSVIP